MRQCKFDMPVGKPTELPISCCCNNNYSRRKDTESIQVITSKLLYRIAFTIWHVAFHIENEQVINVT